MLVNAYANTHAHEYVAQTHIYPTNAIYIHMHARTTSHARSHTHNIANTMNISLQVNIVITFIVYWVGVILHKNTIVIIYLVLKILDLLTFVLVTRFKLLLLCESQLSCQKCLIIIFDSNLSKLKIMCSRINIKESRKQLEIVYIYTPDIRTGRVGRKQYVEV